MDENNLTQGNDLKENDRKTAVRAGGKFVQAMLVCFAVLPILAALFTVVGMRLVSQNPILGTGLGEIAVGLVAVLAFVLLGGKKWLRISGQGLRYGFRLSWPILAGNLAMGVVGIVRALKAGSLPDTLLPSLLGIFVLCVGVGLFEEASYRGVLLNGALAPLGRSHAWVLICVVASSLWFGKVHVGAIQAGDTVAYILAGLKILQAGCFGVIMCAVVLRTREIGGAILLHALFDFMLMSTSAFMGNSAVNTNYTNSSDGSGAFIAYGILLAIILLPTIWAVRSILQNGEEDHGAFMPEAEKN